MTFELCFIWSGHLCQQQAALEEVGSTERRGAGYCSEHITWFVASRGCGQEYLQLLAPALPHKVPKLT